MAPSSLSLLLLLLLVHFILLPASSLGGPIFGFDVHHRFSDPVRRWVGAGGDFPETGSVEYYAALAGHDWALRGRALSDAQELTFAYGNTTVLLHALGFLYYTFVSVGTPNVTFLVALDTGSDLFWLPCECRSCAPISLPGSSRDIKFSTYSPNMSSTSQTVPCDSSYCELRDVCRGITSHCPYIVAYATANTSSSGILVKDVLHLVTEDMRSEAVQAEIVLGCGRYQTGSLLGSAAPNGLFGLGMENISVPSILSSAGLSSNSFSMCFGSDGLGRISFGDKGSSDQGETSFNVNHSHPRYDISITGIDIGNSTFDLQFDALVDSGTSFTYLADPAYTRLVQSFDEQVKEKRLEKPVPQIPFEYCYHLSPNASSIEIPDLNLTTKGGSKFPVYDPLLVIKYGQGKYMMYCLAVVKSYGISIIGQNFMTGLRIVFDRERLILGWKKFDCYNKDSIKPLPANPPSPTLPPGTAIVPSSHSSGATTDSPRSNTQAPASTPSGGNSVISNSNIRIILMLFLLCLAIL